MICNGKLGSAALSCWILFCSRTVPAQTPEWKGSIHQENGVSVVKNPKQPIYGNGALTLENVLFIGKTQEEGPEAFFRLWYLAVDDEGNIYALDQGECRVKVFDENGKYLRAIGRKGEGPGELLNPNEIFITAAGQLVIEDFIRNLTFYSLDGVFIKALSTARYIPIGVRVDASGRIFLLQNIREPGQPGKAIILYDQELSRLKTVVSFPIPLPNPRLLVVFKPEICWTPLGDGRIAVSRGEDYLIEVFDARGESTMKILKDHEPVKITEEDVKQRVQRVPEGRELVVPKYFPAISSLSADDCGHIYARTNEKADEKRYIYDVFDAEGRYIAKIPLAGRPQVWKNQKLYSIEETDEGFQCIEVCKVMWNMKRGGDGSRD